MRLCCGETNCCCFTNLNKKALCETCKEYKCVLPSLATFESRLDNPKTYYLFYVYFYRPAIGEMAWKQQMEKSNDRIGNAITEAFAHMVLKNNYFAWLYDIRSRDPYAELKTEYDTKVNTNEHKALVDCLMEDLEICPDSFAILEKDDDAYKQVRKDRIKDHQDAYARNKNHPCLEMMKEIDEEMNKENLTETTAQRDKKRRRLSRNLKDFTGTADARVKKTKGWNANARKSMEKLSKSIRADDESGLYKSFETTFRSLYVKITGKSAADEVVEDDDESVDYGALWEV